MCSYNMFQRCESQKFQVSKVANVFPLGYGIWRRGDTARIFGFSSLKMERVGGGKKTLYRLDLPPLVQTVHNYPPIDNRSAHVDPWGGAGISPYKNPPK